MAVAIGGGGGGDARCDWGGAYCCRCRGCCCWLTCAAVTDASAKYVLLVGGVCRCRCCCWCCCCGENCDGNCWDGLCGWAPVDALCGADVGASVVLSLVGPEVKKELRSGDRGTYVPSPDMAAASKQTPAKKGSFCPVQAPTTSAACCKRWVALWRSFPVFSSHPAVGQQRTHQVGGVDLLVGGFCSFVPVTWIGRRTELAAVPKTEAGRQTAPGETPPLSSSKSTFCISVHASDQRLHVAGRRAGPRGRPHASEGQADEMPKVVACLESLESQPAPDHDETAALDMVCQLLLWHQPGARCR